MKLCGSWVTDIGDIVSAVLAAFVAVDNDVVVFVVVDSDEKIGRGFQTLNFEAQVMSGPGLETED